MLEFQYHDPVRIRLTGEIGTIVQIDRGRDFPYVVRIETRKPRATEVRLEAFRADEMEPYDPTEPLTPPSGGSSGGHAADAAPYRAGARMPITGWYRLRAYSGSAIPHGRADADTEIAEELKLIRWRMTEIANAIEKRPTTLQLAAIIVLALFALSAAMEIAGGWS